MKVDTVNIFTWCYSFFSHTLAAMIPAKLTTSRKTIGWNYFIIIIVSLLRLFYVFLLRIKKNNENFLEMKKKEGKQKKVYLAT